MNDEPIKQTKIKGQGFEIICKTYADGTTAIESDLMYALEPGDEDNPDLELGAALDAIESLILAQYSAGIKVGSPAYLEALQTTLDAIFNHLD